MAKQQEQGKDKPYELLEKLEIEGIEKHDYHQVVGLNPKDKVVCTIEKERIAKDTTKKEIYLESYKQEIECVPGFFKGLLFNSEGYCEQFKLTLVGVKK
jgi:hypothetical protein